MKLNYSVSGSKSGKYETLAIDILLPDEYQKDSLVRTGVQITMQRGHEDGTDAERWYGFEIQSFVRSSNLKDNRTALKGVWAICKKLTGNDDYVPSADEFLKYVIENGTQWVMDPREYPHYIKPETVKGSEYTVWLDAAGQYATCSVLARDEDEAKRLLCAKLATESRYEKLQEWVTAGMPVRQNYYDHRPDMTDVQSLLPSLSPSAVSA